MRTSVPSIAQSQTSTAAKASIYPEVVGCSEETGCDVADQSRAHQLSSRSMIVCSEILDSTAVMMDAEVSRSFFDIPRNR